MPLLHDLPGVNRVEEPVEHHLDAVYFDTNDLVLAARRMTLRRRTGGDDAGWHLKLPLGKDARREIREPLGEDPDNVPESLLQLVRVHVLDRPLVPVVRLRTRRVVHRLLGPHDVVLAEVCDDRVLADRLVPEPASLQWREWEIELVDGELSLLDTAEAMLADSGVRPAVGASKLARALGLRHARDAGAAPARPDKASSAAGVLFAYVSKQVEALTGQDPRVRQDKPDSTHKMRMATRRLRSVLATYRSLVQPEQVNPLRVELRWLAEVLGRARDVGVMRTRLEDMLNEEPSGLTLGPISDRIGERLQADFTAARVDVLEALDSGRYFRLLDALDALLAAPPVTALASEPARTIVPALLAAERKRLRKAVRVAARSPDGPAHDGAMREISKRAKRLRYALEAAKPVHGKRAAQLVQSVTRVQTILGARQDSVVAREFLLSLGAEAVLRGENGFSYGRLHAREQLLAEDAESRFFRIWNAFPPAPSKT